MTSHKQRMLAGELYQGSDPEVATDALRAALLTEQYNATSAADPDRRRALLAELLGGLGEDAVILPPLQVDLGYQTTIGPRTFINFGATLLDIGRITIGADVKIGPRVLLLTPTHPMEAQTRRAKWEAAEPITIADNAWLGGGVVVCPGVTIGENTVIGAGSIVTRDLPPNVVAVGNPARIIRTTDPAALPEPRDRAPSREDVATSPDTEPAN